MIKLFEFDNIDMQLKMAEHEILLIEEFRLLWDAKRNKSAKDKKGLLKERAWREFSYMYLMLDYKSPYFEDLEQDRHEASMKDSGLSEDEWNDPIFRSACKKYIDIKESSRILKLIKTALRTLDKLRIFLDMVDLDERDRMDKPIFKPKEIMNDIASIAMLGEKLNELKAAYQSELVSGGPRNRGDSVPGLND